VSLSGAGFLASRRDESPILPWLALFLILLCLIPPTGILSDNEEDYFALAARAVAKEAPPSGTAVFDASPHRFFNEHLLGPLIREIGFERAQIITRFAAALAYALVLRALFRCFAVSALDGALIILVFASLGQTLMGGEWLFGDYEAKIPAYCLVIGGLARLLRRRDLMQSALLFALAAYFHFLVGIFWFVAAMALRMVQEPAEIRRLAGASALFLAAIAPLLGTIAWSRLAMTAAGDPRFPSPDVIYSLIRAPHHAAPFLTIENFRVQWLPGFLLAGAMLASAIAIARATESPLLRHVALWLGGLLAYLFMALVASFFDRHAGSLGKFYLFRPAALLLLLWLVLVAAYLDTLEIKRAPSLKLLALALLLPNFLLGTANRIAGEHAEAARRGADMAALGAYLARDAAPEDVVLVDPALEYAFLGIERRTGHPALVMWKFMPTNDRDILEWYRRIEFRRKLFESGCAREPAYRVRFLLATPEHAAALSASCGPIVLEAGRFALLRRTG